MTATDKIRSLSAQAGAKVAEAGGNQRQADEVRFVHLGAGLELLAQEIDRIAARYEGLEDRAANRGSSELASELDGLTSEIKRLRKTLRR